MAVSLLSGESLTEYFKELVEGALAHQRLAAGELTAFYVVNLLTGCIARHETPMTFADHEPLTVQLVRALEEPGLEQRARLKAIGDLSLFTSGFFSEERQLSVQDHTRVVSSRHPQMSSVEGIPHPPTRTNLGSQASKGMAGC